MNKILITVTKNRIKVLSLSLCYICLGEINQKVTTSCGHEYCSECLGNCLWLLGNRCPDVNCRESIDVSKICQTFTKGDTGPITSLDFYFISMHQQLNIFNRTGCEFHQVIPSSMNNNYYFITNSTSGNIIYYGEYVGQTIDDKIILDNVRVYDRCSWTTYMASPSKREIPKDKIYVYG